MAVGPRGHQPVAIPRLAWSIACEVQCHRHPDWPSSSAPEARARMAGLSHRSGGRLWVPASIRGGSCYPSRFPVNFPKWRLGAVGLERRARCTRRGPLSPSPSDLGLRAGALRRPRSRCAPGSLRLVAAGSSQSHCRLLLLHSSRSRRALRVSRPTLPTQYRISGRSPCCRAADGSAWYCSSSCAICPPR